MAAEVFIIFKTYKEAPRQKKEKEKKRNTHHLSEIQEQMVTHEDQYNGTKVVIFS